MVWVQILPRYSLTIWTWANWPSSLHLGSLPEISYCPAIRGVWVNTTAETTVNISTQNSLNLSDPETRESASPPLPWAVLGLERWEKAFQQLQWLRLALIQLLNDILTGGLKVMAMYWLTLTGRENTDHINDLESAPSGLYRHSLMVRWMSQKWV